MQRYKQKNRVPSHQHPILGKIGQIEIIQPAFYDRLSVPPVFLIMVMSVSILGYEKQLHIMTLQVVDRFRVVSHSVYC